MLVVDLSAAIIIAFAFFTAIPMPRIDWAGRRMRFVPIMMPLVGLIGGLLSWLLYLGLDALPISSLLKAVLLALFYVVYTGGLHLDGFMDSADAYFSRRTIERKLEIMKDPNAGPFSVISVTFLIIIKIAVLYEIFEYGKDFRYAVLLIFIPIISRILQSSMLYLFPSAKKDGLTKIYGPLDKRYTVLHLFLILIVSFYLYLLVGMISSLVVTVAVLYYFVFYFSSKKQFGGITGDLLGAFLEITELLMLTAIIAIKMVEGVIR
jgi:adenosylcobinamide-GDP ribazoletransferase